MALESHRGIWSRIVATSSSVSVLLGLITGSVAVFDIARRFVAIDITSALEIMVQQYRWLFHPIVDLAFSWTPFNLAPFQKDVAIFWAIAGAVVWRAVLFVSRLSTPAGPLSAGLLGSLILPTNNVRAVIFAPIGLLAWPLLALVIFVEPIVVSVRAKADTDDHESLPRRYLVDGIRYRLLTRMPLGLDVKYEFDLRIIALLQAGAMVTALLALAFVNAVSAPS